MIEFDAPLRLYSEMNQRCHWRKRSDRFKLHRNCIRTICHGTRSIVIAVELLRMHLTEGGAVLVTITKIGPETWDDDNVRAGAKAVRDQIAATLEVDDGDPRIRFKYEQERSKTHGVRVRMEVV